MKFGILVLIFLACGHLGLIYGEFITRAIIKKEYKTLKLLLMIPIYGLASVLIWLVYNIPIFQKIEYVPLLCIIGMIIANLFELGSGILLNKVLKLNIWDYSGTRINFFGKIFPGHIMGQIDWIHSLIWLVLTLVIIYVNVIITLLAK
jgi:hypothetical protein